MCSTMSGDIGVAAGDPAQHERTGRGAGRREARLTLGPTHLTALPGSAGRRLKVRIHGRPRSDRKRRFLLSAVAPSTSTRHPREASPSTGHSAVGPRQAGNSLLTPRPHFTAPSCTPGNQVVDASDGPPFPQESRPTRLCRTPRAGSGPARRSRHNWELGDRVPGGDGIVYPPGTARRVRWQP